MTTDEVLAQVADSYRRDGYEVDAHPDPADLPETLRREYPAIVAKRDSRRVLVEVNHRGQVQELPPDPMPSGWSYDAILMPREDWSGAPGPGPGPTPEFVHRLIAELEEALPRVAVHARFLVAWSAAEAAIRVVASLHDIEPAERTPRELLCELKSAGIITNERMLAVRDLLEKQTRLSHGAPTEPIEPWWVEQLIGFARELLAPIPAAMAG